MAREKKLPDDGWGRFYNFIKSPARRIRYDELERYLRIYDMTDRSMTMPDIIRQIGTDDEKENASAVYVQTPYRRELSKARKVISNVERGEFPGRYQ